MALHAPRCRFTFWISRLRSSVISSCTREKGIRHYAAVQCRGIACWRDKSILRHVASDGATSIANDLHDYTRHGLNAQCTADIHPIRSHPGESVTFSMETFSFFQENVSDLVEEIRHTKGTALNGHKGRCGDILHFLFPFGKCLKSVILFLRIFIFCLLLYIP